MTPPEYTLAVPNWLEPAAVDEGSLDPLGYLAPAEKIADQLLPGLTVATRRARYLSFLCWAIRETEGSVVEIDRWEVALSVSEHGRQDGGFYFGRNLLGRRQLEPDDPVPNRLHVQTARKLYTGLLRSCSLLTPAGELTDVALRIADEFGRDMPRHRPKRVRQCEGLSSLSAIRSKERRWLREAFWDSGDEASRRLATRREVGTRALKAIGRSRDVAPLLSEYLSPRAVRRGGAARALHEAATLELTAMPLTRLFFYLYQNEGRLRTTSSACSRFRPYVVRDTAPSMMFWDVVSHIRKASSLGSPSIPLDKRRLIRAVYERHLEAKSESPWVSSEWRPLRLGLQTNQPREVHAYRLVAFSGLLADLDEL